MVVLFKPNFWYTENKKAVYQMTEEEKVKFIMNVFECESQLYANTDKEYDYTDKFWLHQYLTKSNIDDIIKGNLETVYQIAQELSKTK